MEAANRFGIDQPRNDLQFEFIRQVWGGFRTKFDLRRPDHFPLHDRPERGARAGRLPRIHQAVGRARDLALLEMDLAERPDHPFVHFNIGMTAFHMKEFDRAVPALERCLALSRPHESIVRKVYAMLAGCAAEQKDLMGARRWVEQGLAIFPSDRSCCFGPGPSTATSATSAGPRPAT